MAFHGQDDELVAAESGRQIARPQGAGEPTGELDEHEVAGRVSEAVVDLLEAVQVEVVDGRPVARRLGQRGVQACDELRAVGQSGQRVVSGLVGQDGLGAFLITDHEQEAGQDQRGEQYGRADQGDATFQADVHHRGHDRERQQSDAEEDDPGGMQPTVVGSWIGEAFGVAVQHGADEQHIAEQQDAVETADLVLGQGREDDRQGRREQVAEQFQADRRDQETARPALRTG